VRKLDFYLAKTISLVTLLVLFGLVGIITLFSFMAEMENMKGGYTVAEAWSYILFTTPRRFYDLIPFCCLIGCLLGLGLLSSNSELIVMRASGVSVLRISAGAMIPVLGLALIGLAVGEFVIPDAERKAQLDRENARQNRITSEFGFWYREDNRYMHFERVEPGGDLVGISHYRFDDDGRLTESLFAERAKYVFGEEGESWWMLNGVSLTSITDENVKSESVDQLRWDSALDPDSLKSEILVRPDKMSIMGLRQKIQFLEDQELNSIPHQLAFWRKSLQPLATVALVFVAITFIIGPLREVSMGVRIVAGMITGIAFKFVQDLLTPASIVFGFSPVLATLVPILLCFVFGVYLMRREV
jgi:lipopolysaccharide export system permease protein